MLMGRIRLVGSTEATADFARAVDPHQGAGSESPLPLAGRGRRLLPATQRVHIHGQRLDGDGIEAAGPGRHYAGAAVGDGLDDAPLVRAVEPDLVGQVRRADLRIALAGLAMTGDAVGREDFPPARGVVSGARRQTR